MRGRYRGLIGTLFVSVLLALCGLSQARGDYNRAAAVQYAYNWWWTKNSYYYPYWQDCTNFVSQCLQAGGWAEDGQDGERGWRFNDDPGKTSGRPWRLAHNLHTYLKATGRATLRNYWELERGDLVLFDWNADGMIDHATIVTSFDGSFPLLTQHSTPGYYRKDKPLWEYVQQYPGLRFYCWHIEPNTPDGRLLREQSYATVYAVIAGAKFGIPGSEFSPMGYQWPNVIVINDGFLGDVPNIPRDYALIRERSDATVWQVRFGKRYGQTYNAFIRKGLRWEDIRVIPNGTIGQIPYGGIDY